MIPLRLNQSFLERSNWYPTRRKAQKRPIDGDIGGIAKRLFCDKT